MKPSAPVLESPSYRNGSFERIFVQEGSCACCRSGMRKNFQPMLFIQDTEYYQLLYVRSLILL